MYDLEQDEELNRQQEAFEAQNKIFFQNLLSTELGKAWVKRLLHMSKGYTPADNPFPIDCPQLGLYLAREAGIRYVGGQIYETLKHYAPEQLAIILTEKENG